MNLRIGFSQFSRSGRSEAIGILLVMLLLGGCHGVPAPQDSFQVRPSSNATILPEESIGRQFHEPKDGTPSSVVAYHTTPTPSYPDRSLSENLSGSLEVADYVASLRATGLFPRLAESGPYTVFAIPNLPLEHYAARWQGGLQAEQNLPALKRLLKYTIVSGLWDDRTIRRAVARHKGQGIGLKTLAGDVLSVHVDTTTNELVLNNQTGETNRLWLVNVPQSNGVLYFTQGVLPPAAVR